MVRRPMSNAVATTKITVHTLKFTIPYQSGSVIFHSAPLPLIMVSPLLKG